jgi:hypothetical protein
MAPTAPLGKIAGLIWDNTLNDMIYFLARVVPALGQNKRAPHVPHAAPLKDVRKCPGHTDRQMYFISR